MPTATEHAKSGSSANCEKGGAPYGSASCPRGDVCRDVMVLRISLRKMYGLASGFRPRNCAFGLDTSLFNILSIHIISGLTENPAFPVPDVMAVRSTVPAATVNDIKHAKHTNKGVKLILTFCSR